MSTSRRALLGAATALAGASTVNIAVLTDRAWSKPSVVQRFGPTDARLLKLGRLHADLLAEVGAANARGDFAAGEVACNHSVDVEVMIFACRATTLAGVALKARVARLINVDQISDDDLPLDTCRLLESVALDIERLAAAAEVLS